MNLCEQPSSKQWAALNFRGAKFAEVWLKPDGDPLALAIRIPQASFQLPGIGQLLTAENLLKSVGVSPEAVSCWCVGPVSHAGMDGANPELRTPLSPPARDVAHLEIRIRLTPTMDQSPENSQVGSEQWRELAIRWKAVVGVEAAIDTMRINMEGLQAEMEASFRKTMGYEEKLHAKRADVANWTKAKTRVHNALPKAKEFIHRAVWAAGSPERKHLGDIFKEETPPAKLGLTHKLLEQLENLLKDRQILLAHGTAIYQECKGLSAHAQEAYRTLQSNAAANLAAKKKASGSGKFFKSIRKASGSE